MQIRAMRWALLALSLMLCATMAGAAAPYAALVMDARSGRVLHAENADTRLHPASLTKMMTLYVVFQEIQRGRMTLDQRVRISDYAASKPPSKLGLRPGQRISVRYLIRASAVRSANDAAAALAEAVSGSERAFADRMTATARAMGLTKTRFRNASGLTQAGHLSTAREMAILGRRLFYDFPQYYNLFSRRSTDAGVKTVHNTNRRLLAQYKGADGIKTGFTRAAGYNLVASAERGRKRVIVSVFGGRSTAWRNKRVMDLMDLGFQRMPNRSRLKRPRPLPDVGAVMAALPAETPAGRRVVVRRAGRVLTLKQSARPRARPERETAVIARAVNSAVNEIMAGPQLGAARGLPTVGTVTSTAGGASIAAPAAVTPTARTPNAPNPLTTLLAAARPTLRPRGAVPIVPPSGTMGTGWAVDIGGFGSRTEAERMLLRAALQDAEALDGGKRQVLPLTEAGRRVFHARFVGLSQHAAETACARLRARAASCEAVPPAG